jgi:predicted nucleotidyltransferase
MTRDTPDKAAAHRTPHPVDPLDTPDDAAVGRALRDFTRALERLYGPRLKGIYLFGSRARGDHTVESDADVAVVLADGDWDPRDERMRIADLEYDTIVATGAEPQAWPLSESEWLAPERHHNPALVKAMRRDAVDLLRGG